VPREEAQEVKVAAIAKAKVKITIVFLIFVVFKIETINCLVEDPKSVLADCCLWQHRGIGTR
jgi:hypothetical protein